MRLVPQFVIVSSLKTLKTSKMTPEPVLLGQGEDLLQPEVEEVGHLVVVGARGSAKNVTRPWLKQRRPVPGRPGVPGDGPDSRR